jgi:hypothetical protein
MNIPESYRVYVVTRKYGRQLIAATSALAAANGDPEVQKVEVYDPDSHLRVLEKIADLLLTVPPDPWGHRSQMILKDVASVIRKIVEESTNP